jgi:hypothetical protein
MNTQQQLGRFAGDRENGGGAPNTDANIESAGDESRWNSDLTAERRLCAGKENYEYFARRKVLQCLGKEDTDGTQQTEVEGRNAS